MHLLEEDEEVSRKKIKIPINSILTEGNKYLRLLQVENAISSFQRVLDQDSNNQRARMGRAKCYMRLAKYDEAWQDFHHVLKINPDSTEALYFKGMTEYLKGNFESSFITNWDGFKRRPGCSQFRQSYQLCQNVIRNNLKSGILTKLTRNDVSKLSNMGDKDEKSDHYSKSGLYSTDLKVLESILKTKHLTSVHSHTRDLFNYLRQRQKLAKMLETKSKGQCNKSKIVKNKIYELFLRRKILAEMDVCKSLLEEGKPEICLKQRSELLQNIRKLPPRHLEKLRMETYALHLLGLANLLVRNINSAMMHYEEQLNVARKNNMKDVEGRALRDIGEVHFQTNNYSKAFSFFAESLNLIEPEEKTILLYKLSDCSIHLNNFDYASISALKCLDLVKQTNDTRFQVDIKLLLAEIEVKRKNMEVAERCYKEALEKAYLFQDPRCKDIEKLLSFFKERVAGISSNEMVEIVKTTENLKHNPSRDHYPFYKLHLQ